MRKHLKVYLAIWSVVYWGGVLAFASTGGKTMGPVHFWIPCFIGLVFYLIALLMVRDLTKGKGA